MLKRTPKPLPPMKTHEALTGGTWNTIAGYARKLEHAGYMAYLTLREPDERFDRHTVLIWNGGGWMVENDSVLTREDLQDIRKNALYEVVYNLSDSLLRYTLLVLPTDRKYAEQAVAEFEKQLFRYGKETDDGLHNEG